MCRETERDRRCSVLHRCLWPYSKTSGLQTSRTICIPTYTGYDITKRRREEQVLTAKQSTAKQANINSKGRAPNTEVKWTATCLKLGDALTPPCDLMCPFRAGKLLNSFKHIEHISLFFASALSGSVSLFWPLFLISFFLAWKRRRDISLACSLCCRGSVLVKEVNKIL